MSRHPYGYSEASEPLSATPQDAARNLIDGQAPQRQVPHGFVVDRMADGDGREAGGCVPSDLKLEERTEEELHRIAKYLRIDGCRRMSKDQLLVRIRESLE